MWASDIARCYLPIFLWYDMDSMEGIRAVIVIMESEPPSGHAAGKAGCVIGDEASFRRERLNRPAYAFAP